MLNVVFIQNPLVSATLANQRLDDYLHGRLKAPKPPQEWTIARKLHS
jgi:hypothetical protein